MCGIRTSQLSQRGSSPKAAVGLDMLDVFAHVPGKNENVVQTHMQHVRKDIVYHGLENNENVGEPEWYN